MRESLLNLDESEELILTPLLDMIFLVLIFFALNLSFQSNRDLKVTVPNTENIRSVPDEKNFLLIEISSGGTLYVDKKKADMDILKTAARDALAGDPESAFYIAADDNAAYSTVMKVLDSLTLEGIANIRLITQED